MARNGVVSILIRIRDGGSAALAATQARLQAFSAKVTGYFRGIQGALATAGIGLTIAGITAFVVRATMEFQRLGAQLRIFSGDARTATAVMNDLRRLAMDLPFDLATITEAFVTLRTGGINPSELTMRRLGDVAAGMGKDIGQLAQAVKNGLMGEMEMLKQFGFKMTVEGDQLRASFGNTSKLIGRDAKSILGFIEEIAQAEFAGAAAERMQTLEGAFSNLRDKAWSLAVLIGEQGGVGKAIAELTGQFSLLLEKADQNRGAIVKWSEVTIKAVKWIGSAIWSTLVVPWHAVVGGLTGAAAAVVKLGAESLGVLNKLALGAYAITGSPMMLRAMIATDPSTLRETASDLAEDARTHLRTALEQLGDFGQRGRDLFGALIADAPTIASGPGGGLAGTTTTPGGGDASAAERSRLEAAEREWKAEKARLAREEAAAAEQTKAILTETVGLTEQINRGAGVTALTESIGLSKEQLKAMNAEIAQTIAGLQSIETIAPSMGHQLGGALIASGDQLKSLEQTLVDLSKNGIERFVTDFASAFTLVNEGWAAVGDAMVGAIRGALAQMAAELSRFYAIKASVAFGEALIGHPGALAAAGKFLAASAAFAAMAGVAAGGGGGRGGGGGSSGRFTAGNRLDELARSNAVIYLEGGSFINLNDPRAQDSFVAMLEKLSGRNVEIRRR